jgi:gamma-glutamyltranspeptidase/glutathione hydrolase
MQLLSIQFKRLIFFILLAMVLRPGLSQDRLSGKSFATRSSVMAQHGMACTSQPIATMTDIGVLKKGGKAIDDDIWANDILCVKELAMNGIEEIEPLCTMQTNAFMD